YAKLRINDQSINIEETDDDQIKSDVEDQVIKDAEKNDAEKVVEEKDIDEVPTRDEQDKDDQVGVLVSKTYKEKPKLLVSISSHFVSYNYDIEITSMVDVQIQQEIPSVLSAPLLDVLAFVVPPTPPPLTTTLPLPITSETSPLIHEVPTTPFPDFEAFTVVQQKVSESEKDVKEIKQVDHLEAIIATIKTHVPSVVNEYLGSSLGDALQKAKQDHAAKEQRPSQSSKPYDQAAEAEFKQKEILFNMMRESKSYEKHPTHQELYDALMQLLIMDEDDIEKAKTIKPLTQKKRRHDDKDQDPLARPD
ncbi:hypothetical protein Tco_1126745, partial [Tanacetum coccineum]